MKSKTPNKRSGLPFWTLLLSNIAIIIWATLENWKATDLIWVYWLQTLALSVFSSLRLLRFPVFLNEDDKSVKPYFFKKPEKPVKILSKVPSYNERNLECFLMLLGSCIIHGVLCAFFIGQLDMSLPNTAIYLAGIVFFINQLSTFLYQKKKDLRTKVFVDKYQLYNSLRVLPINFTFIVAFTFRDIPFGNRIVLLFFLLLKTALDTGMYLVEGELSQELQ